MKSRIYYTKPSITDKEVEYATDAARNGWGEQCYAYINRFEDIFKKHLDVKYAIATSSCTGALHMGMAALDIGPSDEVIMADINWIATAAPIIHLGAKPIFVDVLPDTWCIDPGCVEAAITSKTKAIIAVHLYGNLCEMNKLLEIGKKYDIPVIEDAAEAIGSVYHGKRAGSIGKFGTFSFHGTKTVTTGEGGMFVTNDYKLYEQVLTLSNHGRVRGQAKQFWSDIVGFKYKMSNIQAAIGCAQLERITNLVESKQRVFKGYAKALKGLPITMNPEKSNTINGYWMPTIIINKTVDFDRRKMLNSFEENNVDGRVFFWPLSILPMFDDKPENKVGYSIYERGINLPSYYDMKKDEINYVANLVRANIGKI